MFVSIGLRLRIEIEALNMVEALGAYTRHRTVSVLKRVSKEGRVGYKLIVAPAVSGQSIANGYHRALVELANLMKIPVCEECKKYETRGGFDKRSTLNKNHDERISECVVEDLTGFLAPQANVRRTSPVSFSYLVPDVESSKPALDPQFHVKYNLETNEHAPFTIESGTAIYMLSIAVDVEKIGKLSNGKYVDNRCGRIELAFKAIDVLIQGLEFGAKKARYLPVLEVVGGIAAVSHPIPFVVSAPRIYSDGSNYIADTMKRAKHYVEELKDHGEKIKLVVLDKEGVVKPNIDGVNIVSVDTLTGLIKEVLTEINTTICKT